MQWHQDTFELPDGAILLMTGKDCTNQAFSVGNCTYAFQFHLEVTPDIIRLWFRSDELGPPERLPLTRRQVEDQMAKFMKSSFHFARKVTNRWLDLVEAGARLS